MMKRLLAVLLFGLGIVAVLLLTGESTPPRSQAREAYDHAVEAWSRNDYDEAGAYAYVAVMRAEREQGADRDDQLLLAAYWLALDCRYAQQKWFVVKEVATELIRELERQNQSRPAAGLSDQIKRAREMLAEATARDS